MGVGVGAIVAPSAGVSATGAQLPNPAGAFLLPDDPNIADFITFLAISVKIPVAALPLSSPWPGWAFSQALQLVINPPVAIGIFYTLAVYNCATHLLFMITPDVSGQNFFTDARSAKGFGLIQPSTGIVVASADVSTSQTLAEPTWASGLTIGDLGMMRTPWGRGYLNFAQSFGPRVWGLT